MSTLITWSGNGLSGELTTSSAASGDTAPSFITGAVPTIEPVALRSPAIRFAQDGEVVNYASWVFSLADLTAYSMRLYGIFTAFAAATQFSVVKVVNAGETLLSWGIALTSTGLLRIMNSGGGTAATGTVALTAGTRYRIEATVNGSQYDVYAYEGESSTVVDHVSAVLVAPVAGGRLQLGNAFGAPHAPPMYLDDLAVTDTSALIGAAAPTGWAPDYITADELAAYLRIDDADDDVELAIAATSASRAIDNHCNRQFGLVAAPEERFYTARYDHDRCRWVIDVDDFMTTTGLAIEVDGVVLTGYTKEPVNAVAKGRPWTRLLIDSDSAVVPTGEEHEVAATVRWGWTTVPTPVTQAARLQASRFHSRRDSPYGIAGSPDTGSEMRLLSRVDPDVGVSLRGLVRPRAVG